MDKSQIPTYQHLDVQIQDYVMYVTLARPSKRNAIDAVMIDEIIDICRYIDAQATISAVVVSGEKKVFCAGGDIHQWSALSPEDFSDVWLRNGHHAFDALARLTKPVIAVLNGHTFGGGLELAACCDYRIAEQHICLGQPESSLGIIPGWSGTQRAVRRFGTQAVRRMALFGEVFDAHVAQSLGIVDKVVPTGQGQQAATQLVQQLSKNSPRATRLVKMLINAAENEDLERVLERLAGELAMHSDDLVQGITAFREKRQARYRNIPKQASET